MAQKNKIEKPEEKLRDIVLKEYKNGNIVISDFDGIKTANLDEIMNQPLDGLLYDINRSEAVILTFIDDLKWVNDYALVKVVRRLHAELESLKKEMVEKTNS